MAWLAGLALAAIEVTPARAAGYDWMFHEDTVAQIDLGIPAESRELLADEPKEYVPATFAVNGPEGEQFGPVAVELKLKGSYSFRNLDGKASFKLKFAKANRPWGLKKVTLNGMVQDPTKIRETLAYEVFRAMNVPSSRTGYAQVTVDGEPYGLYLNLETLDDLSLGNWPGSLQHLYEGTTTADFLPGLAPLFEVDEGDEQDISDLLSLIDAAAAAEGSDRWMEEIEPFVDIQEMVRVWAVEAFIGHWDGYVRVANNYYVASNDEGVFRMLPSGTDQSFVWSFAYFHVPAGEHRSILFRGCLADVECRAQYANALAEVRQKVTDIDLQSRAVDLYNEIRPLAEADPRRENTMEEADSYAAHTTAFITDQANTLGRNLVDVPLAPGDLAATGGDGSIEVSWKEAGTWGAAPVSGYLVGYRPVGADSFSEVSLAGPASRSVTIDGLRDYTAYEVTVRATSGAGDGEVAALADPVRTEPAEDPEDPGPPAEEKRSTDDPPKVVELTVDRVAPRLRQVRRLKLRSRSSGKVFLRVDVKLENPAIRLQVSPVRTRPSAQPRKIRTFRLVRHTVAFRRPLNPRWARVRDAAGNASPWVMIR